MRRVVPSRQLRRGLALSGVDVVALSVGVVAAFALRYDFDIRARLLEPVLWVLPGLVAVQVAYGLFEGLYQGRWKIGSFDEASAVVRTAAVVVVAALAVTLVADRPLPLSVAVFGPATGLLLAGGARYFRRAVAERRRRPNAASHRVLVYGAGEAGIHIVGSMLRDPNSRLLPVAFIDDDPAKAQLRFRGVPVLGDRQAIERSAQRVDADTVLFAIPSAGTELVRAASEIATRAGLRVLVLPAVDELLGQPPHEGDIRALRIDDLLGRRVVDTHVDAVASYVTDRRVLVTGAGGSIGFELCRQLKRFSPASLVLVDRDESALHATQLAMDGRALLDDPALVVADIRDADALAAVFAEHRPEVVFHAAALKHLTLLQRHPAEAVKTNVWGTLNVLEVARHHGVERFVNISTDKAADPSSVLGYTKLLTERLTSAFADRADGTYLSVRFGNVLGSRGSVLTAFRAQVEAGGPLTVTHPDVTRYFMTVEEAVQLVIQSGAIGTDGTVMVLDMGVAVRVADVARQLIANAERPLDIVFTGLRPGEKLHEQLFGADEVGVGTAHPLLSAVASSPLDPMEVLTLDLTDPTRLVGEMRELCRRGPATSDYVLD